MTKREFIMQYVLNRALGNKGGLTGEVAVSEGAKAWEELEKVAPPTRTTLPQRRKLVV